MPDPQPSSEARAAGATPVTSPGVQRQMEIYQAGMAGQKPVRPLAIEELERKAREGLPLEAYTYVAGGAGGEETVRANREAFRGWRIVPRFLRDVARRDLSVSVLGQRFPAPLLMAPVGVQSILHPEAELAVARAAQSLGVPLILSTVSSTPLEIIARTMGTVPHWFQLYW